MSCILAPTQSINANDDKQEQHKWLQQNQGHQERNERFLAAIDDSTPGDINPPLASGTSFLKKNRQSQNGRANNEKQIGRHLV
jgi:hypothetical protein